MTHDELLAYINKEIDQAAWTKEYYPFRPLQALRAVVELHKPDSTGKFCEAHLECWGCGEWGSHTADGIPCDCNAYPCSTIQAIETELS